MRALKGGLPRVCEDHRSAVGVRYRLYCQSFLERLGPLPKFAMPKLAELASIELFELPRLREAERKLEARKPSQKMDADLRRIARTRHRLRTAARNLEHDLERLGQTNGHGQDLARRLAAVEGGRR